MAKSTQNGERVFISRLFNSHHSKAMTILNDLSEGSGKSIKELQKMIEFEDDGKLDIKAFAEKHEKKRVSTFSLNKSKKIKV